MGEDAAEDFLSPAESWRNMLQDRLNDVRVVGHAELVRHRK